jgi:hypothetical protein
MDFDITQGIAILGRSPGTLHAMLHDLGAAWIDATEGPRRGARTSSSDISSTASARTGSRAPGSSFLNVTNRSRDGETVPGRNRTVARVLAHRGPMNGD